MLQALYMRIRCNSSRDTYTDIEFAVHAHPTLSEVLDKLFKSAKVGRTGFFGPEMKSSPILHWLKSTSLVQVWHLLLSKFST
ncbi:unnamed protein product, partial [Vitis vinifera]